MFRRLISISCKPEDGHYQAPKHVVIPYVENTLYSTNKCSCFRRVHTLYISYLKNMHYFAQSGLKNEEFSSAFSMLC